MKAQSHAGLGTGSFTLMLGHTVLHVRPRNPLAAPDTDVLVSSTAQRKVRKNGALRTGHHVLWYVNTHMHTRRCAIHHKLLLMRFLQKIIIFDRKVKSKIKFPKIIIFFQIMLENTKYDLTIFKGIQELPLQKSVLQCTKLVQKSSFTSPQKNELEEEGRRI